MDLSFVRRIAFALAVIGVIAILFNTSFMLIVGSGKSTIKNILTFIQIGTCTIIMIIGYRNPKKWIGYVQTWGTWLISFFSLLDNPVNIAGIFFAIICYLLFLEHKIIKMTLYKILLIISYFIPIIISILFLGRSYKDFPAVYLLTTFFCYALYEIYKHKKQHDRNVIERDNEIIRRLTEITDKFKAIAKEQNAVIMEVTKDIEEIKRSVES